ncbi:TlpA disulfide reductase family protein [Danxiaibacter flavus]|uniref:TlpA disulfide reductase family protein n=1 Tax=Danxiaibacter flavus TaxID=3049108 RepID=A0ABV3ZJT1_9BACT|nr:TlpA disulfide reductase family protein [Chitinophagaceae bacterium DXS]
MNKTFFLLAMTVVITTFSFSQTEKKKFEITGKLSGFPDSTVIYLYENNTHQADLIDSTFLISGQFHFTGSFQENAIQVLLQTKGSDNYKFFWLENSTIIFTAEKGKFKEAVITGSKTQEEAEKFDIITGGDKLKMISYIRNNPGSTVSASVLSIYSSTWGKDTSTMLYNALTETIKKTSFGQNVLNFISLNKNPKVGDKYVDFGEPDIDDKIVHLSDFKNKVVLLDFWGSWCGPCRANNPELVKVYNEFKSKGFEIFGVAADLDKESWIAAIKKDGLTWQNVTDLQGWNNKAAIIYGIYKYPTNYLIDRNGIIVATDLQGNELINKLRKMLN